MALTVTPAPESEYRRAAEIKSGLLQYLVSQAPNKTMEFDTLEVDVNLLVSSMDGEFFTMKPVVENGRVSKYIVKLSQPDFEVPYPGLDIMYNVTEIPDEETENESQDHLAGA